jgi:uncharacterized protein YecA (UPF0149 family)
LVLQEEPDLALDLTSGLVTACKMMNYDVPEMAEWEAELQRPAQGWAIDNLIPGGFGRGAFDDEFDEDEAEDNDGFDDEYDNGANDPMRLTNPGRPGRNEACPCGSGKKYKKCCLLKERTQNG